MIINNYFTMAFSEELFEFAVHIYLIFLYVNTYGRNFSLISYSDIKSKDSSVVYLLNSSIYNY